MVATRRAAKLASEAAAAPANTSVPPAYVFTAGNDTLNAPPKRGGRKKADVAQAAEPTPAAASKKRKATANPGAAPKPAPKKRATKPKATRAATPKKYPELVPPPAKRAASGRKAREAFPEAATQVATTRSRRGAAVAAKADTDTPMKDVDEEEADLDLEDAPKPSRAHKAATSKKPNTNGVQKPASRARKAQAPQNVAASVPAELADQVSERKFASSRPNTRVTRSRNNAAPLPASPPKAPARKPTKKSPLKAPARKPTKKAAAAVQKPNAPEPVGDPFAQYPTYPTTPAHIAAPLSTRQALQELPRYPNTPSHITAPISSKDALAELPDYPKTPAHIKAPISVQDAMNELPGYPKTPAHISVPKVPELSEQERKMIQRKKDDFIIDDHMFPGDTSEEEDDDDDDENDDMDEDKYDDMDEDKYDDTDEDKDDDTDEDKDDDMHEDQEDDMHEDQEDDMHETPEPTQTPAQPLKAGSSAQDTSAEVSTPYQTTPPVSSETYQATGTAGTPAQINWGMTNQEAFQELPAGYPKTPAHITAPVRTEAAPAASPSSLGTPALATDAAIQSQTTTSPKKDRSSPVKTATTSPKKGHSSPVKTATLATDIAVDTQIASSAKKDHSPAAQTPALVRNTSLWARLTASAMRFRSSPPQTPTAAASAPRSSPQMSSQTPEDTESPAKSESSALDAMDIDSEGPTAEWTPNPHLLFNPYAADLVSSKKSSLRSPDKSGGSSPKKAVTWVERDDADLLWDGPLKGTTFYVDIKCAENQPDYLFAELLEDLGARVVEEWDEAPLTHVLFKDGSSTTLEKVTAGNGIQCVSTGWVLECEAQRMRVDEGPFLVDLSARLESSPLRAGVSRTPARTPSKYALALAPSPAESYPATPTSSEWERSFLPEGGDE